MKKLIAFFLLISTALCVQAGFFNQSKSRFLTVDEAFQFSLTRDGESLVANWQIAADYYLYRDKLEFRLNGKTDKVSIDFLNAQAQEHNDTYFGKTAVFYDRLSAQISPRFGQFDAADVIEISYQGCTEGFCYPPEIKSLQIAELPIADKSTEKITKKTTEKSTALLAVFYKYVFPKYIFYLSILIAQFKINNPI